ncbi:hypothetical protein B0H13DRAFT_2515397 [Mycena leptocephala]|nr:hypothetical protein B0H13DRAFT_2515397 [Mycena leptocephala]
MFSLRTLFLASVSVVSFTQAFSLRNALADVPSNASYVALDQVGGWLVSFTKEGKEISRHCRWMAPDSGFCAKHLELRELYSSDQSVLRVFAPSVQNVQLEGSPHCTTSTGNIAGSIVGTDGSVSLSFVSGYSSTSQWSVDFASQLSFSNTVEVSVGIPKVADVSRSDTISVSLTNTVGKIFPTRYEHIFKYSDETCFQEASGEVEFIATGRAWFNYNTAVNGYHAYGLLIEAVLPNDSDRNSYMSFLGGINGACTGTFNAAVTC